MSKKKTVKKRPKINSVKSLSQKKYETLIRKRKSKKKLTKKQNKKLDDALFIRYCRCIKKLQYDPDVKKGLEYPICMSSVYTKRGFKADKDVKLKCKKYR